MFESLSLSNLDKKEEECEECLHKDILYDAILDGRSVRICKHCVTSNNAIIMAKPGPVEMEAIERRTVRDVMRRATGITPRPLERPVNEVKLEDLRKRAEEIKAKRMQEQAIREQQTQKQQVKETKSKFLDEKEFAEYIETLPMEKQTIPAEEIEIDFSQEATKKTRLRDLLEKMKLSYKRDKKEVEKIQEPEVEETKQSKEEINADDIKIDVSNGEEKV